MLWVYDHYKYFNSVSGGTVFIRQNLTYKDSPRSDRVKTLNVIILILTQLLLCLATATHNINWVKITHICLICDQIFANFAV